MTTTQENGFLASLAKFEKWLETPVVPGELSTWLRATRKAGEEVGDLLGPEIKDKHGQMLREISGEDSELAQRVEDLKAKDKELISECETIRHELDRLCEMAEQAEPHEEKLDEHLEDFTAKALNFVIESRKQNNALTTWYMESLTRDRGIAD